VNASVEELIAMDTAYFKKGLRMAHLCVADEGLTNTSGRWTAVWRPGKGPLAWVSALPANIESLDQTMFSKGRRIVSAGTWVQGGVDIGKALSDFFKEVWDGITGASSDDNSQDPSEPDDPEGDDD
jgi:hypothetical protein